MLSRWEELADYRRAVAALYTAAREESDDPETRWQRWRAGRDRLFLLHPQSPLTAAQKRHPGARPTFFDYDLTYRFLLPVTPLREAEPLVVDLPEDGSLRMRPVGHLTLPLPGAPTLTLYWIEGYGGGLFLPFRDQTAGVQSYGGGRYLLDTIKHADLGQVGSRLVVDFNFAYNPSCAYHPRWHCPLAPRENWLDIPLPVGEMSYPGQLIE